MKKSERLMIFATVAALALLLGATIYRQQKVAGEEIVRVEIHYASPAPINVSSTQWILKYQASGEKAIRTAQQWQLDSNYQILGHPSFWMSDYHNVTVIQRNGQKSKRLLDIVTNRAWSLDQGSRREGRLTPESLRYFRALLTPQKPSSSKPQNKK